MLYQAAEKYINEVFWPESHDRNTTIKLSEAVEKRLVEDDKAKDPDYYSHRASVVHASSLTKCLRGVLYEMLGAEKDKATSGRKLGIFKAGNLFEDFVLDTMKALVIHQQREYQYKYKGLLVSGRSDATLKDGETVRVGECKSVHSESFWNRHKEGTLVAWHNQVQLQEYMWFERILDPYKCATCDNIILANFIPECQKCKSPMVSAPELKLDNPGGYFIYVSKDDVTTIGAPIKFNQNIIDKVVIPALDLLDAAYKAKDPNLLPVPELTAYSEAKHQWQTNWLCTYCDYHCQCAGKGWALEASAEVTRKNKEAKDKVAAMPHLQPKDKPTITVIPAGSLPPDEPVGRVEQ